MHFIVPDSYNDTRVKNGIKNALKNFACKSAILSIISTDKHNCITKEKYEEMYKTNEKKEKRKDLSVGEDLDTFFIRGQEVMNGEVPILVWYLNTCWLGIIGPHLINLLSEWSPYS